VDQGYDSDGENLDVSIDPYKQRIKTDESVVSVKKVVLQDDKPQPNLNLNNLDPQKNPNTSQSMLEFAILSLSQRLKLTPKYAAGLLANSFKLLAQIVIKGLKKD